MSTLLSRKLLAKCLYGGGNAIGKLQRYTGTMIVYLCFFVLPFLQREALNRCIISIGRGHWRQKHECGYSKIFLRK